MDKYISSQDYKQVTRCKKCNGTNFHYTVLLQNDNQGFFAGYNAGAKCFGCGEFTYQLVRWNLSSP